MISVTPFTRLVATPWALTRQVVSGWTGYLGRAVQDPTTPVGFLEDTAAFWTAMLAHDTPTFAHPNTVVRQWPIARLRDFTPDDAQAPWPTLVLPPRSGMTSAGVDLSLGASLVGTLLDCGHDRAHSLEWLPPSGPTAAAGIEEHVAVVRDAIDHLGGRVHLVGYSQGGWLAAMVAALDPDSVVSLTLGAAPIDCQAGLDLPGRLSYKALGGLSSLAGERLDDIAFRYPGILQAGLLRTMEWTEDTARTAKLWAEIGDPQLLTQNAAIRQWLNSPEDLPGPFVRWSVDELFAGNKLIAGELTVADEPVRLSAITCPLFLIAGEQDLICPPEQLWAIIGATGTPADEIYRATAAAGHLDLLFDRTVLAECWAPLLRTAAAY